MQRWSRTNLFEAAIDVDPFKSRIQGNAFAHVAFNQFSLYGPLFVCLCVLKSFAECVDEHKTDRLHPGDRDPVDAGHRRRSTAAAGLRAGDDLHLRRHRSRSDARRGGVADRPADERHRPRCASRARIWLTRSIRSQPAAD